MSRERGRSTDIPCQERKITSHSMPGEEDEMIFHVSRGYRHQIRCQERKITSDSISADEDNIRFDDTRGR
jgi:hypothetical protein